MSNDKTPPGDKPEASWTSGVQRPAPETSSRDGQEEGGFLRRWSRRKGAQAKSPKRDAAPGPQVQQADVAEPVGGMEVEVTPEEQVRGRMITSPPGGAPTENDQKNAAQGETEAEESELPDVEEMDGDSDFTPFLKKGVSEQLQRKALRKLWLSDPVLANVDGLLDYGDDFTDAAMVIENMKTVYTVGRGMVPEPKEPDPELETAVEAEEELEEEYSADAAEREEGEVEDGDAVSEDDRSDDTATAETRKIAQDHEDGKLPAAQRGTEEALSDPDPAAKA